MDLQVFKHSDFGSVRVADIDGEPWFVGKDVAEILGYSNIRDAIIRHVDKEDKGVGDYDTLGGIQNLVIINESGLYSLILSSKKPEAKKFKRWVTSEVLPSIRKHGLYAIDDVLNNPDSLITALTALKEEREKTKALEQNNKAQQQQIEMLKPKTTYYDAILQSTGLVPTRQIAKDYGLSAQKLNKILSNAGILFKQSGIWYLYQKYAERGYMMSKTFRGRGKGTEQSYVHNYWTQPGRVFLYWVLSDLGYKPTSEAENGICYE